MPRKTKDAESKELEVVTKIKKEPTKKVASKTTTKKTTTTKATKKIKSENTTSKVKKVADKKAKTKKTTTKSTTTKKASTSTSESKSKKATKKIDNSLSEYYDLPYRYNETIVKILAQTPSKLFVYWDISDDDRRKYVKDFGEDFFNNTVPVLIVHNETLNYSYEIEINDFANCWYLNIDDSKCDYKIELGRRSKKQNYFLPNNYLYVASSNDIEAPNDHILFEKLAEFVNFRNVKNNNVFSKNISDLVHSENIARIYNIYEKYKKLYSKLYKDEDLFSINNPSSGNPTSTFK